LHQFRRRHDLDSCPERGFDFSLVRTNFPVSG